MGSTLCLTARFGALLALASGAPLFAQGSPPASSPQRFGELPDFRLTERSGETITLDDLAGQPWIGIPFFVRCTGPCPSLTADLRAELYDELEGTGIRLVSFSVDPKLDTPEALRAYAEQFQIEDDRWLFLTGEEDEVYRFVRDGLKVPLARSEDAELEYGQSITHGTRLPVIDPEGRIAGWYECARGALDGESETVSGQIDLMLARARALAPRTSRLPLVNAALNGMAFLLLLAGLAAIKAGRRELHARLMTAAFVVSMVFLGCYLYYHLVVQRNAGPTRFHGAGWTKGAYLAMLASHVLLAMVNLPMVLRTLWLAHREDWDRHKRLARWTLPIWLYVSITGVLVYLVLYHWNPAPGA